MTLLLTDEDVRRAMDMPAMVGAVEGALREEGEGSALQPERLNLSSGAMLFRVMPVMLPGNNLMGFKAFHGSKTGGWRYLVAVYDATEGALLALMDAHYLTAARTGAASGVATKFLARPDSRRVAVIGSGLEARTNLEAVCAVRPVQEVRVFSPRPERRERFAQEMSAELGIPVRAAGVPEEAVRGADIVVVATNTTPGGGGIAFQGDWMEAGMHVNSIGSTMASLREIDAGTFRRADRIVIDAPREQLERESGDVIDAQQQGCFEPGRVESLKDVVLRAAGEGRSPEAVTLYKSVGEALQDVSAGHAIYLAARERGIGTDLGEFLLQKRIG